MKKIMSFFILMALCACENQAFTTMTSPTQRKLCEDAGLKAKSVECANYINTINQRAQQEHLIELQRQGVPIQYDECVQSLPISTVYNQIAIKIGISAQDIQAFIPESTLNDFAKCTCSSMIYGGLMPDDAIRECQTKVLSGFLSQTKDAWLEFCTRNTLNEIRHELEQQNAPFEEQVFMTKYSGNIIDYCTCVLDSKETILQIHKEKPMDEKIHLAEMAGIKCAETHLKLQ